MNKPVIKRHTNCVILLTRDTQCNQYHGDGKQNASSWGGEWAVVIQWVQNFSFADEKSYGFGQLCWLHNNVNVLENTNCTF